MDIQLIKEYIFGNDDGDITEEAIYNAEYIVAEAWMYSRFNENNLNLEKIINASHCTDWLIFAGDDEKQEVFDIVTKL